MGFTVIQHFVPFCIQFHSVMPCLTHGFMLEQAIQLWNNNNLNVLIKKYIIISLFKKGFGRRKECFESFTIIQNSNIGNKHGLYIRVAIKVHHRTEGIELHDLHDLTLPRKTQPTKNGRNQSCCHCSAPGSLHCQHFSLSFRLDWTLPV